MTTECKQSDNDDRVKRGRGGGGGGGGGGTTDGTASPSRASDSRSRHRTPSRPAPSITRRFVFPLKDDSHIPDAGVRERGETPFRQIFWSRNGAPANIVGHRWNAKTEAFRQITSYSLGRPSISLFSGPNCPQTRDFASKIYKKNPDPLRGRGRPPALLHAVRGGASSHVAGTKSRKPSPQIKIYHYTPDRTKEGGCVGGTHVCGAATV